MKWPGTRKLAARVAYKIAAPVGWKTVIRPRVEELLRELGMLLLALAPLDGALADMSGSCHPWKYLPLFLSLGVLAFGLGVALEVHRRRDV